MIAAGISWHKMEKYSENIADFEVADSNFLKIIKYFSTFE